MCESESVISDIDQLDGNVSVCTDTDVTQNKNCHTRPKIKQRAKNASVAHHLPVVSVCNFRSLFPKIENF